MNFQLIRSRVAHLIKSCFGFGHPHGTQYPSLDHICVDNPRKFYSPLTQSKILLDILNKDQEAVKAIFSPHYADPVVVVMFVVDNELRFNVYESRSTFSEKYMTRIYDPKWTENGKFVFRAHCTGEMELISRSTPGCYYDMLSPLVSFTHLLTVEEENLINQITIH